MVTSVTVDNCFLVQRVSETVITLNLVLLVNQKVFSFVDSSAFSSHSSDPRIAKDTE